MPNAVLSIYEHLRCAYETWNIYAIACTETHAHAYALYIWNDVYECIHGVVMCTARQSFERTMWKQDSETLTLMKKIHSHLNWNIYIRVGARHRIFVLLFRGYHVLHRTLIWRLFIPCMQLDALVWTTVCLHAGCLSSSAISTLLVDQYTL